mmetsp:Transcript_15940/g.60305  ORF Transcript_15940/g.60305 Transcript_15940/m.60305 type:complete len:230 (-) Transcript_15940:264-953(-)
MSGAAPPGASLASRPAAACQPQRLRNAHPIQRAGVARTWRHPLPQGRTRPPPSSPPLNGSVAAACGAAPSATAGRHAGAGSGQRHGWPDPLQERAEPEEDTPVPHEGPTGVSSPVRAAGAGTADWPVCRAPGSKHASWNHGACPGRAGSQDEAPLSRLGRRRLAGSRSRLLRRQGRCRPTRQARRRCCPGRARRSRGRRRAPRTCHRAQNRPRPSASGNGGPMPPCCAR